MESSTLPAISFSDFALHQSLQRNRTSMAENSADLKADWSFFGEEGGGFADMLDIINPLQHIPIVGSIYRNLTGDTLAPFARLAGGGLFGGVIGLAGAAISTAVNYATGDDIGGHITNAISPKQATAAYQKADGITRL